MNMLELRLRNGTTRGFLRSTIAPIAATIVGALVLADAQAAAPDFYAYLEQGYRETAGYAVTRAGNVPMAEHFTAKAQLAAAGQTVTPDLPLVTTNSQSTHNEMMTARSKLMLALAAGAERSAPRAAAIAEVNFDCWLAQLKGADGQPSSADCRRLFYLALAQLPTTTSTTLTADASAVDAETVSGDGAISAVSDTSSPGPAGTGVAAVSGVMDGIARTGTGSIASVGSAGGSALGGVTDAADNTLGGVGGSNLAGAADSVSGAVADASATGTSALGGAGSAAGSVLNGAGSALGNAGNAAGGAAGSAGNAAGGAAGSAGNAAGGAVGGAGSAASGGGGVLGGGGGVLGGGGGVLGGGGGVLGGGGLGGLGGGGGGGLGGSGGRIGGN